MNLKERALNNEINCKNGVMQLLYSLAEYGLLKEPYRSWASGFETIEGEELKKYNEAISDLSESLLMFDDEIKEYGKILK